MTILDLLQWSSEHGGTLITVVGIASGVAILGMGAYRVALAIAQLRAWWRGGDFLGRSPGHQDGGVGEHSREYAAVMSSPGWRRRRREAIRRAHGRCAECGAREQLQVHHAHGYARLGRERAWELVVLCKPHHDAVHGKRSAVA